MQLITKNRARILNSLHARTVLSHTQCSDASFTISRRYRGGHSSGSGLSDNGGSLWDRAYNRVFGFMTKENDVKSYVPESVQSAGTDDASPAPTRTAITAQKLVDAIQKKATISEVRRMLDPFLMSIGARDIENFITEDALNYLVNPVARSPGDSPHALVLEFQDHLTRLLECNVDPTHVELYDVESKHDQTNVPASADHPSQQTDSEGNILTVRIIIGMALSNIHTHKYHHAYECSKLALVYTKNPVRKAGIYALQAGVLNALQRYSEACETAEKAIRLSSATNSQAFLHGATALCKMGKTVEAASLLERASNIVEGPEREKIELMLSAQTRDALKIPK